MKKEDQIDKENLMKDLLAKVLETQNSMQGGMFWDMFHLGDMDSYYQ